MNDWSGVGCTHTPTRYGHSLPQPDRPVRCNSRRRRFFAQGRVPARNPRSMNQAYDLFGCIGHYQQYEPVKKLFQLGKAQHLSASLFFLMKLNEKRL
jgi:hypothetical protein